MGTETRRNQIRGKVRLGRSSVAAGQIEKEKVPGQMNTTLYNDESNFISDGNRIGILWANLAFFKT